MNDHQLIKGCLQNDRRCQQALFQQYAGRMMTVCLRYATHAAQAQDMLQETFVKVFTHLHQFNHSGSLEGWIRRIAVNTALRHLQREKKHLYWQDIDALADEPVGGHDELDALETRQLLALIQQLPVGYRTVLNLFVFEQMTHDEIAALLGISSGTSRSQLAKARRYLQQLIAGHIKKCMV